MSYFRLLLLLHNFGYKLNLALPLATRTRVADVMAASPLTGSVIKSSPSPRPRHSWVIEWYFGRVFIVFEQSSE